MTTSAVWLWYPGDFEIHQGMLQNFKREERGMGGGQRTGISMTAIAM